MASVVQHSLPSNGLVLQGNLGNLKVRRRGGGGMKGQDPTGDRGREREEAKQNKVN